MKSTPSIAPSRPVKRSGDPAPGRALGIVNAPVTVWGWWGSPANVGAIFKRAPNMKLDSGPWLVRTQQRRAGGRERLHVIRLRSP